MEERREEIVTTTTGTTPVVPAATPVYTTPVAASTQQVQQVSDTVAGKRIALYRTWQLIFFLLGLLEALLIIRFLLRLFGANPRAGFAQFIYGITGPFMAPFNGLFGTPSFEGSVLETNAIIAMIVYALLAWLIYKIIEIIVMNSRGPAATTSTTVETTQYRR